jgi:hypothetical protein
VSFAGAYLFVAGLMNLIWGIVALSDKSAFSENGLVWSTLDTWGWIAIVSGTLQVVAGLMILARRFAGQWLGGVLRRGGDLRQLLLGRRVSDLVDHRAGGQRPRAVGGDRARG